MRSRRAQSSRWSGMMLAMLLVGTAGAQPLAPVLPPEAPEIPELLTVAESSAWRGTSLHADVVRVLDAIAARAPELSRRLSIGQTTEGRGLEMIVLSDPPVGSVQEARDLAAREGRVKVLIFGNIHGGEVDAKEAYLMLARELALREHPGRATDADELLRSLIIFILPNYNADGNERIGPLEQNRRGQAGPELGAGQRHTALDRDLNRDWIKLECPETRAMVRFMNEWDPHVIIDGHTTNGSFHRYVMTYAGPKVPAGDPRLIAMVRDEMFPAIDVQIRERHGIDTYFYGDFAFDPPAPGQPSMPRPATPEFPHTRWTTFPAQARYSTGYIGMRGRIGILSESYSYTPYRDRITGSRALALEVLRYAAAHRQQIIFACANADAYSFGEAGHQPVPRPNQPRGIALRSRNVASSERVLLKGYVEEEREGRVVSTNQPADYLVRVEHVAEGTRFATRPFHYAFVDPPPAQVLENLATHGIQTWTLGEPQTVQTEIYTITDVRTASRLWQGHILADVTARADAGVRRLEAGTVIIDTAQPLGALAIYMLEPEGDDGLAAWNFFDAWLAPGERFPVARVMQPLR